MTKTNLQSFLDGDDWDEVKFGEWDGTPVIFNIDEAWLLNSNTGLWEECDPGWAGHKSKLAWRREFEEMFPGALASLPAHAFGGEPNWTKRGPGWWMT